MARVPLQATTGGMVVDSNGKPVASYSVYLYLVGTTTQAPVYLDRTSGTTLAQPLVTNAYGYLPGFVADDQELDVYDPISGNRYTTEAVSGPGVAALSGGSLYATQTLAANGAVTIDASTGASQDVVLQANATSATITNASLGQRLTLRWIQDATGGRTYVWPTNWIFSASGSNSPPYPISAAGRWHASVAVYDGTNWNEVAEAPDEGPWRSSVPFSNPADLVVQGTWNLTQDSTSYHAFRNNNGTGATGDGAAWKVDLSAGTWSLYLLTKAVPAGATATIDISYDGGTTWTSIGTADTYAASAAATRFTFTGIVAPHSGPALVRFRALTRNASNTTGWTLNLSGMEWVRTA